MIRDRLVSADGDSLEQVKAGEGKILKLKQGKVAVYRDESGTVTSMSAVCPHMGCLVHWNGTDSTWDCPCHGSRFQPRGELFAGPAESPMKRIELEVNK